MQTARGTAIVAQRLPGLPRLRALAVAIGVLGLAVDQATKAAALAFLDPQNPPHYLGGLITLQLTANPGAAFSMGENFTVLLTCVAIAAFLFVAGFLVPRVRHSGWAVAEGFLLAGIVGNLTDRLVREPGPFHGHVIDFIQLPNFAIFNVADICISTAAVLIVWFVLIAQVGPDGRSMKDAERNREAAGSGDKS